MFEEIFDSKLNSDEYLVKLYLKENGKEREEAGHYICYTCKRHLMKGNMPPMCAANGLKLFFFKEYSNFLSHEWQQ